MKILCDLEPGKVEAQMLREGVAPYEIIVPEDLSSPMLETSFNDPASADVEIAFGQPELSRIEQCERLRWIHLTSAGYARYDTPEFRAMTVRRGLALTNSSSVYAEPCAEHALAFMLAQTRRLPQALRTRAAGGTAEWSKLRRASGSLQGEQVLILGFGAIASHLIKLLAPFQMKIVAMRRRPRGDEGVPVVTPLELSAALATSDHVVNLLPDNADSRNFVDAGCFNAMKRGAAFYNIGRGATVDQQALLEALRLGHLEAAWLDVTEPEPLPSGHPLLGMPNCFITPHTAGGQRNEPESLVRHFLDNFRRFRDGLPLQDRVM
jgi:phosphoglycerate dehydrogenase-like enzyme